MFYIKPRLIASKRFCLKLLRRHFFSSYFGQIKPHISYFVDGWLHRTEMSAHTNWKKYFQIRGWRLAEIFQILGMRPRVKLIRHRMDLLSDRYVLTYLSAAYLCIITSTFLQYCSLMSLLLMSLFSANLSKCRKKEGENRVAKCHRYGHTLTTTVAFFFKTAFKIQFLP